MPCRRAPRDGRWEASYLNVPAFPLRAPVDAAEMYCLTATTFQHLVRRGPGNVIVFVVLLGAPLIPFGDQGMVSCCATRAAVCLLEGEGLLAHDTGSNFERRDFVAALVVVAVGLQWPALQTEVGLRCLPDPAE